MTLTDYVSQEKNEEKDWPALKTDASIQQLEDYKEKRGEKPITATRNDTDNRRTNRTTITRKQKWEEKQLYGRLKQLISNILHKKT